MGLGEARIPLDGGLEGFDGFVRLARQDPLPPDAVVGFCQVRVKADRALK